MNSQYLIVFRLKCATRLEVIIHSIQVVNLKTYLIYVQLILFYYPLVALFRVR